jgi:hypothetical protein
MLNLKTTLLPLAELLPKTREAVPVVELVKPVAKFKEDPLKLVTSGSGLSDVQVDEPSAPLR